MLYHLQERAIEHAVMPWCEQHGVAVVGLLPVRARRLSGRRAAGGRVLAEIAAAHGGAARQVALAFLTRRPSRFAIPKAANAGSRRGQCRRRRPRLSEAEIAGIDAAFPRGPKPRGLPML